MINEVTYELADARLIRFDGTDARIDPTLKVNAIVVETLNGVSPSSYALSSSLDTLSERVDSVESISNRFYYEDGTTNLHLEFETT